MSEAIRIHDHGERVRAYQGHLNDRVRAHGLKPIAIDGTCGPETIEKSAFTAWFLGAISSTVKTIQDGTIPSGAQAMIVDPRSRVAAQRERASERRGQRFPGSNGTSGNGAHGAVKVLTGIDVSSFQPDVDWKKVKAAGHSFAFVKASEGLNAPDRAFGKGRWSAIREAGLVRGAYHFARPQKGRDPKAEVREFLGIVERAGGFQHGDLLPVLDIEAYGAAGKLTAGQTVEWVHGFVEEMRARAGKRPIVYTGSFWRDAMGNPDENFGCPLWLAAYDIKDPKPFVPKAWTKRSFAIWQHTDKGTTSGVSGQIDLNRIPGGQPALALLRC